MSKYNFYNFLLKQESWTKTVDITTLGWIVMFVVGFLAFDIDVLCLDGTEAFIPQSIINALAPFCVEEPIIVIPESVQPIWQIISWIVWGVFLVDVIFKYRAIGNWKIFLRKHWFDILLLIPFFRILRVMRTLRLLRIVKVGKVAKVAKTAKVAKSSKAVKPVKVIRNLMRAFKKTLRFGSKH